MIDLVLMNGYLTHPEPQHDSVPRQGKNPGIPTHHRVLSPPSDTLQPHGLLPGTEQTTDVFSPWKPVSSNVH